jgi:hypothetical protein
MRIALIAVAALCVIYFGDALVLRLMHQPYGVVQVRRYYAMPLKGNKTPCWYASRKKEKWVTE